MNRILTLVFVAFAFVLSGCAEPVKTRLNWILINV